jgi:hypothetical protein
MLSVQIMRPTQSVRVFGLALLAMLAVVCSHRPTAPTPVPALAVEPGFTAALESPPSSATSIRTTLGSCRGGNSTIWTGCDGSATVNVSKPVTSGYVSLVLNYGCGTAYTCPENWHGEFRVSSTTPGSIVIPLTSTSLTRSQCTSPMTTVANVFDARDGRGDPSNQLYSVGFVLTLNCGTSSATPPSASFSAFNGTWRGTFTGQASGNLVFTVENDDVLIDEPEDGTGSLSVATSYGYSAFYTRSETNSCTWTGPFLPGGARQSSASGLWSCSNGTSGQWSANRTTATSVPPPTSTTPTPTTPTPAPSGNITILSTTSIRCTEAGAGYNCRTGTIEIRNDSSSLVGRRVRLSTNPSHILAPVFTMPAVNGTMLSTVSGTPSTFSCPPRQTSVSLLLADGSANAGTVLATKTVSMSVSCQ